MLRPVDYSVIAIYGLAIVAISLVAGRRPRTAVDYFIAGRSMPAWAVAMAMMAALISSNTLVGHPATAYRDGLILLLGNATLPFVLILVARYIVPFYRHVVGMSAYEYIGARFGLGGRLYASACFVIDRIVDIGATIVTTAIPVTLMTGWSFHAVILALSAFTALYTMAGGMRTVVWTSVIQGFIFIGAAAIIILRLLFAPEAGAPGAVVVHAWEAGRFSLGSFELTWGSFFDASATTQWLFLLAYAANWARRYIADQHMVQRYLIARSDRDASRAALWNGLICVPVWATFMLIGVCLFGYYHATGAPPPALSDQVVPHFIMHHVPAGLVGLLLAAILAASMSSISPDLNSVGTVLTTDHVGRMFPGLGDRTRVMVGRAMVGLGGLLAAGAAFVLIPDQGLRSVMERVVTISAVLSGGMLGLFFLGFLTRRATRRGCYIGIAACVVFTAWGTLTEPRHRVLDLGFNFEMHPILIGIFGHVILFVVGYVSSRLLGGHTPAGVEQLTFRRVRFSTP